MRHVVAPYVRRLGCNCHTAEYLWCKLLMDNAVIKLKATCNFCSEHNFHNYVI